jgi:LysM repeat protein
MAKHSISRIVMVTVAVSLVVLLGLAPMAAAEDAVTHTVKWGETLGWIAWMYKASVSELVATNNLVNANTIYAGQKLVIPGQTMPTITHKVVAGETLLGIAAHYGVSIWDISRRNGMWNINTIYVGQELVIPTSEAVVPPAPEPTLPTVAEAIIIESPTANGEISSPVIVQGWGSAFENTLAVDVLDANGVVIGQGFAMVDAEIGQTGPFSGTIIYTAPAAAELGRVAVYAVSARDGAIEHLASVTVNLVP